MCLAIYKPANKTVDWDALAEGFASNRDGAGFAVVSNDVLQVVKGLFTFDQFREAFEPYANEQAVIHFRLATHGLKDEDNCHPFHVSPELVLIHNGVLDIACDQDKTKSDTWHYANLILGPMSERDRDFYNHGDMMFLGEAAIGSNKFVFLRADGDFNIWNESLGHWHNDCWFSNRSYEKSSFVGFRSTKAWTPPSHTWWRDEVASSVDPEAEVIFDQYDTDNSNVYDELTDRDQLVYDALLADGWDISTLDEWVDTYGMNSLYEIAEKSKAKHAQESI
jgi:glutamine amidotransferase